MITLLLLSWKRVENILKIIDKEFDGELISEVIVWNNNPNEELRNRLPEGIRLIQVNEDFGIRTRFAMGLFANNDCILYHDDDTHIPNLTIKNMFNEWSLDEDIMIGLVGGNPFEGECSRCISSGNEDSHDRHYYNKVREGKAHLLLGHGVMLHRKHCCGFFIEERNLPAPPNASPFDSHDDIVISYYVMSKSHKANEIINSRFEWLGDGGVALSDRDTHYEQRRVMMENCQTYFSIKIDDYMR